MHANTITDADPAEQFADDAQRRRAAEMGMWLFLSTEALFFGGLILAYSAYRTWYPEEFRFGSRHLDLVLGTINTLVLLTSSFFMAGAVTAGRLRLRATAVALLILTALLGSVFLCIKGYEWYAAAHDGFWPGEMGIVSGENPGGVRLFFSLYYIMTGVHGLHLIIGILLVSGLSVHYSMLRNFSPNQNVLRNIGLYWHFVDVVWVFLFPILYFIGRAHG